MRKSRRNHQIPMRKHSKINGKPYKNPMRHDQKPLVNHQIPLREDEETT